MAFKVFQLGAKSAIAEGQTTRRDFLRWTSLGWFAMFATMGSCVAAMGRFMFPNVTFDPPMSFRAGSPEEFPVGIVDERYKEEHGVWIVRTDEGFYALAASCTHLGCVPNWRDSEQKFKCPCHGSGFYKDGVNFEGPAPRPLERFRITLSEDGQLLVDKSRSFRQELGQWKERGAFLSYAG